MVAPFGRGSVIQLHGVNGMDLGVLGVVLRTGEWLRKESRFLRVSTVGVVIGRYGFKEDLGSSKTEDTKYIEKSENLE